MRKGNGLLLQSISVGAREECRRELAAFLESISLTIRDSTNLDLRP
jgi:hypothetical protein